jgi:hypothetical protein
MAKINVGILYISLHNLLKKKIGENNVITRKEFFCILGKHFLVPKCDRPLIIKEMEERDLIKQENCNLIKILKLNINQEELYEKIGL